MSLNLLLHQILPRGSSICHASELTPICGIIAEVGLSFREKNCGFLPISSSIGGLISSSIAGSSADSSAGPPRAASSDLAVIFRQELRSCV